MPAKVEAITETTVKGYTVTLTPDEARTIKAFAGLGAIHVRSMLAVLPAEPYAVLHDFGGLTLSRLLAALEKAGV